MLLFASSGCSVDPLTGGRQTVAAFARFEIGGWAALEAAKLRHERRITDEVLAGGDIATGREKLKASRAMFSPLEAALTAFHVAIAVVGAALKDARSWNVLLGNLVAAAALEQSRVVGELARLGLVAL